MHCKLWKVFIIKFLACFLLSTSTSRLLLIIRFTVGGVAKSEIVFSIKKEDCLAQRVSSSDSIKINLGNLVISFAELDSERFHLGFCLYLLYVWVFSLGVLFVFLICVGFFHLGFCPFFLYVWGFFYLGFCLYLLYVWVFSLGVLFVFLICVGFFHLGFCSLFLYVWVFFI